MAERPWTEESQGSGGWDSRHFAERVRAIAAPIVRALDLELVDVDCVGQGARTLLRVYIDKPGGVTLDDCEQTHLSLGHALDVEDPIPHAYTLEVSSPGLDRPLKRREDYRRSLGKLVSLKLRQPSDGQWRVTGRLIDVSDEGVTLSLPVSPQGRTGQQASQRSVQQTTQVAWDRITEARLEVEF